MKTNYWIIAIYILVIAIFVNAFRITSIVIDTRDQVNNLQETVSEYITSNEERMSELEQRVEIIEETLNNADDSQH